MKIQYCLYSSNCLLPHKEKDMYNKVELTVQNICTKFITLALVQSGIHLQKQIWEKISLKKWRLQVCGKKQ